MNDADVDDHSSTEVEESGYQLVLPSGDYLFYTISPLPYDTLLVDYYYCVYCTFSLSLSIITCMWMV